MSSVVDPNVDAMKVMQSQPDHAVNFLGMPDVTRESGCALRQPDAIARRLSARRIARQQDHTGALLGKQVRNGFADTHRSAGDHNDLSGKFHDRVVFISRIEVKITSAQCRRIQVSRLARLESSWRFFPCSRSSWFCFP